MKSVDNDTKWAWAQHGNALQDLKDVQNKMREWIDQSEWWTMWNTELNFSAWCKKTHEQKVNDAELAKSHELQRLIEAFEQEVHIVLEQHRIKNEKKK